MPRRLKLNVKNVILGCNNFSEILARNDCRILTGISPSSGPRAILLNDPGCNFYKQDYVKTSTLSHMEAAFPRKLDKTFLKPASAEISITGKCLDEEKPGQISVFGGLWKSLCSFRDDRKNPHCPPLGVKSQPASEKAHVKSISLSQLCLLCPLKPEKSNPCANGTLCALKTGILNSCRFYRASPCQPQPPKKKASGKPLPCGLKRALNRPKPKCRPMPHKRPILNAKDCGSGPKKCEPKLEVGKCSDSSSGGDPCAGGKREAKKDCYGSDSKDSGSKKGPVCPQPKCK